MLKLMMVLVASAFVGTAGTPLATPAAGVPLGESPVVTQDCAAAGPYVTTGLSSTSPIITNNGSTVTTNGVGCDGCTFNVNIKIKWRHSGDGVINHPGGGSTVINGVADGSTTTTL